MFYFVSTHARTHTHSHTHTILFGSKDNAESDKNTSDGKR